LGSGVLNLARPTPKDVGTIWRRRRCSAFALDQLTLGATAA